MIKNLNDSQYKVRRDAFLQLCDSKLEIDDYLVAESASEDLNRSRVAAWLLKLRKSSGDPAGKFEMLADYQAMLEGDKSPLFQRILDGRWSEVLDLLRTVPQESFQDLLERDTRKNLLESRFVGRLIDQAWRSGNEWAVPQIVDIFASDENRVGINRWWREIGMPEEWRVTEAKDPKTAILRLAADGKFEEALSLAKAGRFRTEADRIAIESGNWDAFVNGSSQNSILPTSGVQSKMRLWALALVNNNREESESLWQEIKQSSLSGNRKGQAVMAMVMNDTSYFEEVVTNLSEVDAFSVLYFSGRVKEAFRRVGLDELTPESLGVWLKNRRELFVRESGFSTPTLERDLISLCSSAFHNLGVPELEDKFDKFWMDVVSSKLASDGPAAMKSMIVTWILYNQREKAVAYLSDYSKKNVTSVAYWLKSATSPTDIDSKQGDYAQCVGFLFGNQLAEPMLILQHVMSKQTSGSPGERIESSIKILDDLYFGRKPAGWQGVKELIELRKSVQEQLTFEAEFTLCIARLMDLFGDTPEAFKTMRGSISMAAGVSEEYFWELASLQEKLGYRKAASDTLLQLVDTSINLETFLRTAELLEKTGRYADLDRLRFRWLSCVSRELPTMSVFLNKPELIDRPEVDLYYDRGEEVAWAVEKSYADVRYQISKNDPSKSPKAKRAALQSFTLIAPGLLLTDDARRYIQAFIGPFALDAVLRRDADAVSKWLTTAASLEPGQIQIPIDIIPEADKHFDKETVDVWFDLFWNKMNNQIEEFPNDAMSLNNVAWMASQCNRRLEEAVLLARRAVQLRPEPTYMDTLADLEFRLGNIERAIELSQKCRDIEPRDEQHQQQLRRFFGALDAKR